MGEIISFFPLAWPIPFSGPQLGQRRPGRADRSFRKAPRPLSSRWDRSTAQLPPALARRDRANPVLHSKLTAFGPPSSSFVSLRLSLPKLRLRHQGHTAANAEAASHTAPQRPIDRSSAITSDTPGASLEIAPRAVSSGRNRPLRETGEWYDSGTTLSFTGRSYPFLSRNESAGNPIIPNQALTMTHGIEPHEPSKSCPYSRKDEVARHRSARADRSLYAGFLI